MSEWKKVDLGKLLEVKYGKDHKALNAGKIPCLGSGGLMRYVDKYLYNDESILIPRKGSLNNIMYQRNPFWTVDTMFWTIINKELVVPKFLFYQLTLIDYENLNVGSAVPSLTVPIINEIEVRIPSLSEQKFIASILSSLDDKIYLLHRQNATLEKMAETLFRQCFVEPIKKISNEGTVVEGFSNAKFDKWIKETVGGEWGKENAEGDFIKEVYCIRGTDIADLNNGLPEKTPIRFVKQAKFKNIEPLEGDLILEISGGTESQSTGRICYINQDVKKLFKLPLVFSNFCRMIRVKKSEYSFFLYCYIQYLYNQDEFFNLENGSSGIKNLDYKALLFELDYPMPNESLVLDFHKQVKPLFKKVNHNKIQIRTLTALRDTLLPKLMSGELSVKTYQNE